MSNIQPNQLSDLMRNATMPLEPLVLPPHVGTEVSKRAIEATIPYPVCKIHDFPLTLCPYCKEMKIQELEKEVERLKNGRFTPEELQNLCHTQSQEDANAFGLGCFDYQVQLFGPMKVKELYLRVRSEYLKLFQCESCGTIPDDDGRLWHGRNCEHKPNEFEDIQDLLARKTVAK